MPRPSRPTLCARCGEPFVSKHRVATTHGTAVITLHICPDCRPEESTPDLYTEMRYNIGTRLAEGFAMLQGVQQ